jgi:hypothetical protein
LGILTPFPVNKLCWWGFGGSAPIKGFHPLTPFRNVYFLVGKEYLEKLDLEKLDLEKLDLENYLRK